MKETSLFFHRLSCFDECCEVHNGIELTGDQCLRQRVTIIQRRMNEMCFFRHRGTMTGNQRIINRDSMPGIEQRLTLWRNRCIPRPARDKDVHEIFLFDIIVAI